MITGTILIIFGIIVGLIALAAVLTLGGAFLMALLDLIICGFAIYGVYMFVKMHRNQ